MEEVDEDNAIPSPEEIQFEQTVARYDEVLSKLKLLRSRLLMNSAYVAGGKEIHSFVKCLESLVPLIFII